MERRRKLRAFPTKKWHPFGCSLLCFVDIIALQNSAWPCRQFWGATMTVNIDTISMRRTWPARFRECITPLIKHGISLLFLLPLYWTSVSSDGFELEFSGSSEPELWKFRAESSRAGALQFSSWNRAEIFLRTTIKFPKFYQYHDYNQLHDNLYEFI